MNKIAIIGAHGSGKSTLIEKIQNESAASTISVIDIARVCPLLVGKESTLEAQEWILNFQLVIEERLNGKVTPVIFDNSTLGHLAYYQYWGGDGTKFNERILKSSLSFDRIYLLPANPRFLFDDGLRPTDIDFQQQIFEIQKELLDKAGINYQSYNPLDTFSISTFLQTNTKATQYIKTKVYCMTRYNEDYLLLKETPKPLYPKKDEWSLVQGELEHGETPEQGAERLVLEQTGFLSTASDSPKIFQSPGEQIIYHCQVKEPIKFTIAKNNGILGDKWLSKDEFINFMKKADL